MRQHHDPDAARRLEAAARDGSERAGTALSTLLGRPIEVRHQTADLVDDESRMDPSAMPPGAAVGRLSVEGTHATGDALVALSPDSVAELMHTYRLSHDEDGNPDELAMSMLREVSNIAASSYLNAIADAWQVELLPSPVEMRLAGDDGAAQSGPAADHAAAVLVFRSEFASDAGVFEVALMARIETVGGPLYAIA
jgi:chemotaxis protein CheY-P-specific phosphatase CheC